MFQKEMAVMGASPDFFAFICEDSGLVGGIFVDLNCSLCDYVSSF